MPRLTKKVMGKCEQCGKKYQKRSNWQRFCGTKCRNNFHAAITKLARERYLAETQGSVAS
jgi:protein-arginine kinase activator protein McsA